MSNVKECNQNSNRDKEKKCKGVASKVARNIVKCQKQKFNQIGRFVIDVDVNVKVQKGSINKM